VAGDEEEGHGLCFNVAHSHGVALAAVSWDRPVGVDVEKIRGGKDLDGLAERYFSTNEIAALREVSPAEQSRAFYLGWTRKEAFIKALGLGLAFPLDAFDVSLKPGEPASLLDVRSPRISRDGWTMIDVELGEIYAAAAVTREPVSQIRLWHTLE
jgi:4'-phosphopantetheinyl transferase